MSLIAEETRGHKRAEGAEEEKAIQNLKSLASCQLPITYYQLPIQNGMMSQTPQQQLTQSPQFFSSKRLWLPLLLQTALILAVPAQALYTQMTGKTVFLQTLPVDPYDFLRGYSQTLSYEISRLDRLQQLPGWQELSQQKTLNSVPLKAGTKFYVVLAAPASGLKPPQAWKPVRVSSKLPDVPANQIAIRGKFTNGRIEYGLETYYMPESQSQAVNQDINRAQRGVQQQPVVVEVKVDAQGRAVPICLWVSKRNYRF